MPKISILIPAYNVENYIEECLDSVLSQSLNDLEIICVDDASTDNTLAILKSYEKADNRVYVYEHTENKGQASGRNLALTYATGEYVYMLDADDKIVPSMLEELYEICSARQLDVIGFETYQFMDDESLADKLPAKMISYEDTDVLNGAEALKYCMKNDVFSLSVPTFMIRHEYLEKTGLRFVEGILHEDVGFIYEMMCKADRIQFLHKVYFLRRVRANSTMTAHFTDKNIEGYLKSFSKSFDLEKELLAKYPDDKEFMSAVRKWRRDIYGRIRQLYLISEESIYSESGGNLDATIALLFNMIKLATPGVAYAKDILSEEFLSMGIDEVYLCGTGQYTERMIGIMGALDIVVKGVLVDEKKQKSFRGIKVYELAHIKNLDAPVILSVSKYKEERYVNKILEIDSKKLIRVDF